MRLSIQFLVSLAAQPSYIMKKIITANTATTQTVQGSDQPQAQRFAPAQLGARSELEKKSTLVVAVVPAVKHQFYQLWQRLCHLWFDFRRIGGFGQ